MAWQLDLKRRVIAFARSGTNNNAPEGQSTEVVLAKLGNFSAERRFAEAAVWLKKLPIVNPTGTKDALLAATEAASSFLTDISEDLSREPFPNGVLLKEGGSVARLSLATDGSITAVSASGEPRNYSWHDFPADSLMEVHRVLVTNAPSEVERLRRHESAIALDWLAGNRERALAAATELSAASPAFRKRWDAISAGLPR